eukprot:TRINITY_DN6143_c2_g1_i3.p2 TRINITY_DN6143_c2_g1~~TRINITY_DN6143_c2_g1_i3.p2  ORF type:complete len:109 (-),score=3.01 TRINITY_DN6143_c2_g1_i3:115-441(-)
MHKNLHFGGLQAFTLKAFKHKEITKRRLIKLQQTVQALLAFKRMYYTLKHPGDLEWWGALHKNTVETLPELFLLTKKYGRGITRTIPADYKLAHLKNQSVVSKFIILM